MEKNAFKYKFALELGYKVNRNGEAFNKKGLKLKLYTNAKGYKEFSIKIDGKWKTIAVHRLAALIKFGDKVFDSDLVVRHLSGNKADNRWVNLELGTDQQNTMDIPAAVRKKTAVNAATKRRRFSDLEVEEIRAFYKKAGSYTEVCDRFEVSKGTLYYLLNTEYQTKKD